MFGYSITNPTSENTQLFVNGVFCATVVVAVIFQDLFLVLSVFCPLLTGSVVLQSGFRKISGQSVVVPLA